MEKVKIGQMLSGRSVSDFQGNIWEEKKTPKIGEKAIFDFENSFLSCLCECVQVYEDSVPEYKFIGTVYDSRNGEVN